MKRSRIITLGFSYDRRFRTNYFFECAFLVSMWVSDGCLGVMSCGEGELTFEEGHTHSNAHTTNRPVKFYFKNIINCFSYIIKRIPPGFYFLNIEI